MNPTESPTATANPIRYHTSEARHLMETTMAGLELNGITTTGIGARRDGHFVLRGGEYLTPHARALLPMHMGGANREAPRARRLRRGPRGSPRRSAVAFGPRRTCHRPLRPPRARSAGARRRHQPPARSSPPPRNRSHRMSTCTRHTPRSPRSPAPTPRSPRSPAPTQRSARRRSARQHSERQRSVSDMPPQEQTNSSKEGRKRTTGV